MATSSSAGAMIVKEFLNKGNYPQWSICMKNYLLAQDLWDVVEQHCREPTVVWKRENAAAFHAILISCATEAADLILDCSSVEDSARDAWDTLASAYNAGDAVGTVLLTERNYKTWRVFMKSNLWAKDMWDVVKPSQSERDTSSESEINGWREKNAKAFAAILKSCGTKVENLIRDCSSLEDSARESWNTLASAYNSGAVIVKEFLNKENYGEWSACMKKYLEGKGLWVVVAAGSDVDGERKNKLAFHAIWISCGDKAAHLISNLTSAKAAWNKLADEYESGATVDELLRGDNYKEWRDCMRKYLVGKDLWGVVVSGNTGRAAAAAAAAESDVNWKTKNDSAFEAIKKSCDMEDADLISNLPSAKAAWDTLASKYESHSNIHADEPGDWETEGYDPQYDQLYKDIHTGEWEKTQEFLEANRGALTAKISSQGYTPLHAAAAFNHLHIVEGLVTLMGEEDLELKDSYGNTPLSWACAVGSTEMAKCMVKKNGNLPTIPFLRYTRLPVTEAVLMSNMEMARYLYECTPFEVLLPKNGHHGASLLIQCLFAKSLDMALELLKGCRELAITPDEHGDIFVRELARMPSVFPSQLGFFQKWIYKRINKEESDFVKEICLYIQNSITRESGNNISLIGGLIGRAVLTFHDLFGIKQMFETMFILKQAEELLSITCEQIRTMKFKELENCKLFGSIIEASKNGIPEFIIELTKAQPRLVWNNDDNYPNFFYSAIQYRQAKVFSLIYGYVWKDQATKSSSKNGSTMLHMAGKLALEEQLNYISSEALQMRRERLWFKEVESIMAPAWKRIKNEEGKRAEDLFTEEHKNLIKAGEKWMKDTATSCTVIAVIIVTIMFAAAFTIPGGNDQNTGYPIFKNKNPFMIFMISDAVSLFSSSTSVLMFLRILTSRYDEDDFLESLPRKLVIGLSLLFISMATMMVAFTSALFVILEGKIWFITPVILLASVPIGMFARVQFPILVDIFIFPFRRSIFERNVECWP